MNAILGIFTNPFFAIIAWSVLVFVAKIKLYALVDKWGHFQKEIRVTEVEETQYVLRLFPVFAKRVIENEVSVWVPHVMAAETIRALNSIFHLNFIAMFFMLVCSMPGCDVFLFKIVAQCCMFLVGALVLAYAVRLFYAPPARSIKSA